MKRNKFIEIFAWYGTVAIISAYMLISFSVLTPTNIWFQLLNDTGALGIVLDSFYKKDYQPGVLNIIWFIVAFVSIVKILS